MRMQSSRKRFRALAEERRLMSPTLFLLAGLAAAMLLGAKAQTNSLKLRMVKKLLPVEYLPKMISVLIIVAQASELLKMIEHVSIVNVSAALLLLTIVVTGRSGTEHGLD